jgi:hypothetical protein
MKNKIRVSLIFTGGLILGALLSFIILGKLSYLRYAVFFCDECQGASFYRQRTASK